VIAAGAILLAGSLAGSPATCDNPRPPPVDPEGLIHSVVTTPKETLPGPEPELSKRLKKTSTETLAPKPLGYRRLRAAFDDYPRRRGTIRVGDDMLADGVTMTLVAFDTEDDPIDVLSFYRAQFSREGLYTVGAKDLQKISRFPGITAYDPATGLSRTVLVVLGDKLHTVVLGLSDAENAMRYSHELRFMGLPPYPGVAFPVSVRSDDNGLATYTVIFATPDPPAKVAEFLSTNSASVGLKPRALEASEAALHPEDTGARVVSLEGGGMRWTVTARLGERGVTGVVAVARATKVEGAGGSP
jgi:hypothetical protein